LSDVTTMWSRALLAIDVPPSRGCFICVLTPFSPS
jgi:hypothetical protein